jgi:hypothetical protein
MLLPQEDDAKGADAPAAERVQFVAPSQWRTVCGQPSDWIEVVRR